MFLIIILAFFMTIIVMICVIAELPERWMEYRKEMAEIKRGTK